MTAPAASMRRPRQPAVEWITYLVMGSLLVAAVMGLRSTHSHWLAREAEDTTVWAGWVARAAVLLGGMSLVRLVRSRPPLPSAPSVARGLFYLGVLFLAALCVSPFHEASAIHWGACAVGVGVAVLGVVDRLREARPRWVRAIDIALANVCLTLVGLELGLTILASFIHTPLLAMEQDGRGRSVWEWRRQPPGSVYLDFPVNSWGDYDGEPEVRPDGECGVVSIGDSFSTGIVPLPYHFTSVAEAHGSCDVYNMGAPSIGPTEYLYLLRTRAPRLHPTAIVVNLYLFNDVTDVERPAASPSPWIARERRRTYRVGERLFAWSFERAARGRRVGGPPEALGGESLTERYPWLADPLLEEPGLTPERYLTIQYENAERVLSHDHPAWPAFFDTLEAMIDAAGDRLLFMLIPSEAQVEDTIWREVESRARVPVARDRAQRRVREWLSERGVPVLDLLPVLRAEPPLADGRLHLYHARDTHLNARGNAVVGRALAAFLEEHASP